MASFQIGDAIALANLAVDLYQNVYLVAKKAPETYQSLLQELVIIKNVLVKVENRYKQAGRQYYDPTTQSALFSCRKALLIFKPLVLKYTKLASGDGSALRQKLKFPFDQRKIASGREELQKSLQLLHFSVSLDDVFAPNQGTSSATRRRERRPTVETAPDDVSSIDGSDDAAPMLLEDAPGRHQSLPDLPWRTKRVQTLDSIQAANIQSHARNNTVPSIPERTHLAPVTPDGTPHTSRTSGESSGRSHVSRSSMASQSSLAVQTPLSNGPPSPLPREQYFPQQSDSAPSHRNVASDDHQSVHSVRSMQSGTDREEQVPVDTEFKGEIVEGLQGNAIFRRLESRFDEKAELYKEKLSPDLNTWLEVAIWWLVKSRKITEALQSRHDIQSRRTDWPSRVSLEQAAVDVLKAGYICIHIIFTTDDCGKPVKVPRRTWKSARDLCRAVADEIHHRDITDNAKYDTNFERLHFSFTEKIHQAVEHPETLPDALDSLEGASRWMTVDDDQAGGKDQRVIMRTFVNAQIGDYQMRGKSGSAPYMLLLWSQHARSEILVSLLNQSGTVNLSSTLTEQDIKRYEERPNSNQFHWASPSQECVFQFLGSLELQHFLDQPRSFFKKTRDRDPRSEEFLVFREGLQSFRQQTSRIRTSISGPDTVQSHATCEISLYQHVPDLCWKTQRRLVICSALDATDPWCFSYWLPLGDVRVQGDGCDVELHWSDCSQFEKRRDGNWGWNYSFVYNADAPNINITLQFQTQESADEFKAAILHPWDIPFESETIEKKWSFGSSAGPTTAQNPAPVGQELSIWKLMDAHEAGKSMYHSIVYTSRNSQQGFTSTVYLVYRDIDFLIEHSRENSVLFQSLWVPRYVSNVINAKAPPEVEGFCEDVECNETQADFDFERGEVAKFMHALTGYELLTTRRATNLSISSGMSAIKQKNVIVSLWRRPSSSVAQRELRLTARWLGGRRWTTALITSGSACASNGTKVVIRDTSIDRGTHLEVKHLAAVDGSGRSEQYKKPLVLVMEHQDTASQLAVSINEVLHKSMTVDPDPGLWRSQSDSSYMTTPASSALTSSRKGKANELFP